VTQPLKYFCFFQYQEGILLYASTITLSGDLIAFSFFSILATYSFHLKIIASLTIQSFLSLLKSHHNHLIVSTNFQYASFSGSHAILLLTFLSNISLLVILDINNSSLDSELSFITLSTNLSISSSVNTLQVLLAFVLYNSTISSNFLSPHF